MGVLTGRRSRDDVLADQQLEVMTSEIQALDHVMERLGEVAGATSVTAGVEAVLDGARRAFGFDYASAWSVRDGADRLGFISQRGSLGTELTEISPSHEPGRGFGLCGIAWEREQVLDIPDLSQITPNCARGRAAIAAGARSGMSLPIWCDGKIVMVLDFASRRLGTPSPTRPFVLNALSRAVSQSLTAMYASGQVREAARDQQAVTTVVAQVGACHDEESAVRTALDAVREEFGWAYGSFWALDEDERVLRFSVESGTAGEEFRQVTLAASFAEGVGLSGRAWKARDLVFVPDLGELTDCVRAPAAQRAGVRSGVCLPIVIDDQVVGTMDFFTTETIDLSVSRADALRNVSRLVSQRLDILRRAARDADAAAALLGSVEQLSASAGEAGSVAAGAVAQASEIADEVRALSESSTAIEEVIKIISTIADQTNLLALNATIEAARAGQAGRGFAVVATEVKELAGGTTTATSRVGQQVADIQANTAAVARGIEAINATIGRMDEVQHRMSEVLEAQRAMAREFQAR
ncbi:GAF domain-containing protein [Cellulosimicrobium cellulans]|uniref:GAF domain-containing protein n=1 Tax=Cellulosimicrobium cellulans TaxID=1710 RepID=UPI00084877F3|nr:methyl-accepting chemotaxis protein [Cellulosimicrobium cellulans]